MTDHVNRLRELFLKITELPKDQWSAFLDDETREQPQLRKQIEALLSASARPDSLLDRTADFASQYPSSDAFTLDDQSNSLASQQASEKASEKGSLRDTADLHELKPDVVIAGRYKLHEKIGEGGMGEVWVARQSEPVKRNVAVKLIKSGMDSKAVIARFEAERQALAIMDHPNIAKVLDGGLLPGGQPYFVMELVKGVPITEFCDRMKLSAEKRLELFVPVCLAIQHAHQKGIIHRDIKPSNMLVALFDDVPVPKVIDFGIAKATGGGLSDQTVHTAFGGIIGTPQYMSPEQATLNNLDIDTRSDVYSLGVLLYELLTGSPPFSGGELERIGVLEILRVVREEDPPRPSAKLSSSEMVASLSANRSTDPRRLTSLLRSELDWIVLKALEKERVKRYESAQSFASDVLRYLGGEQVVAHPPTLAYQLRKFAQKHRGLLATSSIVLIALLVGLGGTTWQMMRANREVLRANREAQRAQAEAEKAEAAREAAESALAIGFMRPIGFDVRGMTGEELSEAETRTLSELAQLDLPLKSQIFLRAVRTPEVAERIVLRMDRLVQNCFALDLDLREKAIATLQSYLIDANRQPQVRAAATIALVELGSRDSISTDVITTWQQSDSSTQSKAAWDTLIAQLLQSRRDECIGRLVDCMSFRYGSTLADLAATSLSSIVESDPSVARIALTQLQTAQTKDAWLKLTRDKQQSAVDALANPSATANDPRIALWLSAADSAFPDDPNQTMQSLFELAEQVRTMETALRRRLWNVEQSQMFAERICKRMPECDDATFSAGLQALQDMLLQQHTIEVNDFLTSQSINLYAISERIQSKHAQALFPLLIQAMDRVKVDEYCVMGVAMGEVGPKLSAESAQRYFAQLAERLDRDRAATGNLLQAIAGLSRAANFPSPQDAVTKMLEHLEVCSEDYVRNACWRAIGQHAQTIDPATRQRAVEKLLPELSRQLQAKDGVENYSDLPMLLHTLLQLKAAGAEVDIVACIDNLGEEWRRDRTLTDIPKTLLRVMPTLEANTRKQIALELMANFDYTSASLDSDQMLETLTVLGAELSLGEQQQCAQLIKKRFGIPPALTAWGWSSDRGLALASIVTKWPEQPRTEFVSELIELLSLKENRLNSNSLEYVKSEALDALKVLYGYLAPAQKQLFFEYLMSGVDPAIDIASYHPELPIVEELPLELLQQLWSACFENNSDDGRAAFSLKIGVDFAARVGRQMLKLDRARVEADIRRLFGSLNTPEELVELKDLTIELELPLNFQDRQMLYERANRWLAEDLERAELVPYVDDPKLLVRALARPDLTARIRNKLLHRLEQLAFPEEAVYRTEASEPRQPARQVRRLEQPLKHFKTVQEFLRWDQARTASQRWAIGHVEQDRDSPQR